MVVIRIGGLNLKDTVGATMPAADFSGANEPSLQERTEKLVNILTVLPFNKHIAEAELAALCSTPGFDINALTCKDSKKGTEKPVLEFLLEKGRFVIARMLVDAFGADPTNAFVPLAGSRGVQGRTHEFQKELLGLFIDRFESIGRQRGLSTATIDSNLASILETAYTTAEKAGNKKLSYDIEQELHSLRRDSMEREAAGETPGKGRKGGAGGKGRKKMIDGWTSRAQEGKNSTRPGHEKGVKTTRVRKSPAQELDDMGGGPKRALCLQKMQPWELPGQRATQHNPQKPRPLMRI
ncbi:Uncharacterised protein [Candidatus Burarchaeum australiense]|nr:Uncharacterised protein [Candidatus Burarchaeum australiense]